MPMTDEEWNARFDSIDALIKAEGVATRRHIEVVVESLGAEIKNIVEESQKMPARGNSSARTER
jgi:hypothetical protein